MSGPMERHYEDFMKPKKIEEGGLIKLSGSFLLDHEADLVNLINNEGKLASEHDAKSRLLSVEKKDGSIWAKTSTHNLALHIGKALSHAYKGKHEYKFLDGEKFVEVLWERND
ncbi:hypothetical protein A3K48_03135 [candidate division WOR-1 bacterium RIFOXYA12_FULL_52_29]|uniref:Uncharacterized protein n=1 Tax=candidate division WOR-1 bacterium RIFOXYC12_FULL_54_18 TaxID=1802584 RepID=A0A1F4T640_UNCSA|nr:MAG: hypothetical protein A3K44_03135 [candidate division WOR-1 bacterium RIFOXYA2_FULL_51_19]OGC17562.1 MAG: hypothetical protein A3K48_03135 [candidate division WOR-1 bacterium RIFOXYA12_FULL_52_29]OGC26419.1 MAG: hypothetical protein A3K32_03130 [candidate division WOR-1 bacterium RIFOXYB2_FULL_45_9]OGC27979.1 MAG: hypothetical protein A3K49_03135 [candidate division WOR-1 bacterium RIFOXYC12_FULL_54_18]OGC29735.1 MAG: hypothetical protein A2346_03200 [candidate division WOR-1 bacterium R